MLNPYAVEIAKRLHLLCVSNSGIVELMSSYPLDLIERQLDYLPYRKAKRPEAFIIEAVRNNYSPPKEYFYASTQTPASQDRPLVHQDSEHPRGQIPARPQGHGTPNPPDPTPRDLGLESRGASRNLAIPPADETLWPS